MKRSAPNAWKLPSTRQPLWKKLQALARRDRLVLERALTPGAERRRGRYWLRDYFADSIVHSAPHLHVLRTWMMASPEQRRRLSEENQPLESNAT